MPGNRAPRSIGLGVMTAIAVAAAVSTPNLAEAARQSDNTRPWGRGTLMPSFGFGLGLGRDATQIGFGLGVRYFAIGGLGFGLSLTDSITLYSESLKSEFPGLTKRIPTNIFRVTPSVQYVFYRSRWFSPYVHAGVGPSIFNNGRGVVGHWVAGPGAYIGIGGPVYLNIGVDFSSMFPSSKCNEAYRYQGAAGDVQFSGYCGFRWGPNLGIVVAFGGGGSKRRARPTTPPPNPMEEPAELTPIEPIEPAPVEPEPIEPEATPVEPTPVEPVTTEPVTTEPTGPTPMGPTPVDPAPAPSPDSGPVGPTPSDPTPPVDPPTPR